MSKRLFLKFILAFSFLLLQIACAFTQSLLLPFEQLSVENGLPNASVLEIMQDKKGFMWFGTFSGIVRYDGYQLKTYYPGYGERDSIANRDIPCMYQDKKGRIWLGTANQTCKLYQYQPGLDRFMPFQFDTLNRQGIIPSEFVVKDITEDKRGRLLVGMLDAGLFVITFPGTEQDSIQVTQYLHDPQDATSIICNSISGQMSEDRQGQIWIPTEKGLCSWNPDTEAFTPFKGYALGKHWENFCHTTLFDPPHTLWVGMRSKGLLKIDTRNESVYQYSIDQKEPYGLNTNNVIKVAKGEEGRLWVLQAEENGFQNLQQLDIGSGQYYDIVNRNKFNKEGVLTDLVIDYAGNIWIGSWQSGIFKLDPQQAHFQLLQFPAEGVNVVPPAVSSVTEDRLGKIWILTFQDGLAAWDPIRSQYTKVLEAKNYPSWLQDKHLFSIDEFTQGQFLLGSSVCLIRYDPANDSFKKIEVYNGENLIGQMSPTSEGYWWGIDFLHGIFKLNPETETSEQVYENYGFTTFEEGKSGDLFLGNNQYGLFRFRSADQQLHEYFNHYGVHDIQFDREGIAWLSTHSNGLIGFDTLTSNIIQLSTDTHKAIGLCRQILIDDAGMLWINTAQGIVHFDPYARRVLRSFKATNWLQPGLPWYHPLSKGTKLKNGNLAFGSASGLLLFHPDSLTTDTTMPKVALTEFQLFNKVITPGPDSPLDEDIAYAERIVLDHHQNDFSLTYASLIYKNTESLRYRYRLIPQEKEWIEADTRNKVYYTAISPGNYTFEVQAANLAGEWHKKGVSVDILIRRPWWDSWLARSGYVFIMVLLGLGVYRFLLQRVENRRLLELDTLKSRLYTNISHEFRTPLTLILGQADRLKSYTETTARPGLNMIKRNGQQLLQLVNQMLDLSSLEAGKLRLELIQSDVIPFLAYVHDSFRYPAEQRGIDLSFSSELESLQMDFDPGYLQQVLSNLLSNALKFTHSGGSVKLTVQEETAQTLVLKVKDTGIGIAPDEVAQIFDRFYQADGTSTRSAEGVGIGLAITSELVQLMGGSIVVESKLDAGSVFTIKLPITRKAAVKPPSTMAIPLYDKVEDTSPNETPSSDQQEQPCVLIIEDNSDLQAYLRVCLANAYRVFLASDGREGLEKAKELIPDLIISDVMMPVMDGFEVCKQLRADILTSHIPIILLTARADVKSRLEGLELGAEAYLSKPFLKEELLIRVRKLLEIRQQLITVYQKWITDPSFKKTDDTDPDQEFIVNVREVILKNLSEVAFNVPELAKDLGVSRTQLHRKLTQLTGYSASRFIRLIRLQEAKERLHSTKDTIATIAYQCGYSDPNYFSKVFKQEEGVSPTDYRSQKY